MSARLAPYAPGAAAIPVAAEQVSLFTDLHLMPERPHEIAAFAIRLHGLADAASAAPPGSRVVVVMGDLFDAYAGPEDWLLPANAAIVEAFGALRAAGLRLYLLRGNRDVMLEAEDAAPFAAPVADSLLVRLGARAPVLITHGDAFCLADHRYQFLRRSLRRPGLRGFLRRRSVRTRRWLAARLRGVSRGEMARKPLTALDVVPAALEAELRGLGAAAAVLGHLHEDRRLQLQNGLRARVLPAWDPETPAWDLAAILDGMA